MAASLITKKSKPTTTPLSSKKVPAFLAELKGWHIKEKELHKTFKFKNYHDTMAFVNATAWVSHREDHHPDMDVSFNQVIMRYSTHSAGGLTESDFICAAKIDALFSI